MGVRVGPYCLLTELCCKVVGVRVGVLYLIVFSLSYAE